MKTILSIDTSNRQEVLIKLLIDGKVVEKKVELKSRESHIVLQVITDILSENTITLTDLSEIEVATGPGSFTGLRIGAAIANTLGWSLGIPVNGKKQVVKPSYSE